MHIDSQWIKQFCALAIFGNVSGWTFSYPIGSISNVIKFFYLWPTADQINHWRLYSTRSLSPSVQPTGIWVMCEGSLLIWLLILGNSRKEQRNLLNDMCSDTFCASVAAHYYKCRQIFINKSNQGLLSNHNTFTKQFKLSSSSAELPPTADNQCNKKVKSKRGKLSDCQTEWMADWQQLQVGRVDSAFPLFAGNFGAHQLKLWKLIKLKRLPRGHSRGASQPNVWQCLLSCASLGQLQVKTSQHARQPFSRAKGKPFALHSSGN